MATSPINASFANNRNNGWATAKTPSTVFQPGYFVVYTGLGGVIPYSASETLLMTITGTFVLGETVTQATSGATGIVVALPSTFAGSAQGITVNTVTGTFDTSHVVTGGTSSATGTPSAVVANSKILGLSNDFVNSTTTNWLLSSDLNVSTPVNLMDFLDIPVTVGTPTVGIVGSYVNIDPLNPGCVDVTTASLTTGQILVTRVVSSTMIKGVIANVVA